MRVKSGKKVATKLKKDALVANNASFGEGQNAFKSGAKIFVKNSKSVESNGLETSEVFGALSHTSKSVVATLGLAAVALSGASAEAFNATDVANISNTTNGGKNVTIENKEVDGNIYGSNFTSSSNNSVTLKNVTTKANGSQDGSVWGWNFSANNSTGDSIGNIINITDNSVINGSVIGGASVNGTNNNATYTGGDKGASSNQVFITGTANKKVEVKRGVFGGAGAGKTVANNNTITLEYVNVSGATQNTSFGVFPVLNQTVTLEVSGTVLGGVTYGVAGVANNKINVKHSNINGSLIGAGALNGFLENNSIYAENTTIGGNVYGGYNINGTGAVNISDRVNYTFQNNNSYVKGSNVTLRNVNVTGGTDFQFNTEGNVFGGVAGSLSATGNNVTITGNSTISGIVVGGGSFGGYVGSFANAQRDNISSDAVNSTTYTNISFKDERRNIVNITGEKSADGSYSVKVKNAVIGGVNIGNSQHINYTANSTTSGIDGSTLNTTTNGTLLRHVGVLGNYVFLKNVNVSGETRNATFASQLVFETGGVVAGGLNYGNASFIKFNVVQADNAWIGGTVIGGGSSGGNASENTVNLTNSLVMGSIYGSYNINASGVGTTNGSGATLQVEGDASSSDKSVVYLKNVTTVGGINHTLLGNFIVSEGNVWGGHAGKGGASDNNVTIIDSYIGGSVFGGGSYFGSSKGNLVNVSKSNISGGVFGSVSYGTFNVTERFKGNSLILDGVNVTGNRTHLTLFQPNASTPTEKNPFALQVGGVAAGIINFGSSVVQGRFSIDNNSLYDASKSNNNLAKLLFNKTATGVEVSNSNLTETLITAGSLNGSIYRTAAVVTNTTVGGNIYGAFNIDPRGNYTAATGTVAGGYTSNVSSHFANHLALSGVETQGGSNFTFGGANSSFTLYTQGNVIGSFSSKESVANTIFINDSVANKKSVIHGSVVASASLGNTSYNNLVSVSGINNTTRTQINGGVFGSLAFSNSTYDQTNISKATFVGLNSKNIIAALTNQLVSNMSIGNADAISTSENVFEDLWKNGTQVRLKNVNVTGTTDNLTFGRKEAGNFDAGGVIAAAFVIGNTSITRANVELDNVWTAGSIIGGWGTGGGDVGLFNESFWNNSSWLNNTQKWAAGNTSTTPNTNDTIGRGIHAVQFGMFVNISNTYSGGNVRGAVAAAGGNAAAFVSLKDSQIVGGSTSGGQSLGINITTKGDVIGATSVNGTASANVTITASTQGSKDKKTNSSTYIKGDVFGALASGNGSAINSNVTITNATVGGKVIGGYANGTGNASGNNVTIINSIINQNFSNADGSSTSKKLNGVSKVNSTDNIAVIGGYSKDGFAQNNSINIVNSTIYGHICVSYQEKNQYTTTSGQSASVGVNKTGDVISGNSSIDSGDIKIKNSVLIGGSFLRVCGNVSEMIEGNQVVIDSSYVADKNITNETINNSTITDSNITDNNNTLQNNTIDKSNVSNSNLSNNNFSNSNITDSNITDSNITGSNVTDSNLSKDNVTNSNITNTTLNNSNVTDNNISNSTINNSNVTNNTIKNNSTLNNSNVTNNNITDSVINNSNVTENNITNTTLNNSNVSNNNISNSTINNSNVTENNITNSKINNSNVSNNNLTNTTVENSNLTNGTFVMINATGGSICDANIKGDNLANIYLCRDNISNSNISDSAVMNSTFNGSNASKTNFSNADINNSNLNGSTVTGGKLNNSNVTNSLLSNLTLTKDNVTNITNSTIANSVLNQTNFTKLNFTNDTISQSNISESNITGGVINNDSASNISGNNISNATLNNFVFTGDNNTNNYTGNTINNSKIKNPLSGSLNGNNITNSNVTGLNGTGIFINFNKDGQTNQLVNVKDANITMGGVCNAGNISNSNFVGAIICNASVETSNITQSSINNANVTSSNLSMSQYNNVNVSNSNLTGAINTTGDAVLDKVTLSGVNIKDSNVTVAKGENNARANIVLENNTVIQNSNLTLVEANKGVANATITVSGDVEFNNSVIGAVSNQSSAWVNLTATGSDKGFINGSIIGAEAKQGGNATAFINATGANVGGNITGAKTNTGNAYANITATEANVQGAVIGATTTSGNAEAFISANGAKNITSVIGATTDSGNATGHINATKAYIANNIYGAVTKNGSAEGFIHLNTSTIGGDVIGATQTGDGDISGSVRVDGSEVGGNVIGAYSKNGKDANNSVVTFGAPNSTIKGDIYGGLVNVSTTNATKDKYHASNNTVNISAPLSAVNSTIFGGFISVTDAGKKGDVINNRLIIASKNVEVKDIQDFQFIDFYLPKDIQDKDVLLNLKGGGKTDLANVSYSFGVADGIIDALEPENVKSQMTVTLISKANGTLLLAPESLQNRVTYGGLSNVYDHIYSLDANNQKLDLTIKRGVGAQQKAVFEAALAGVAPVVRSQDVIHDMVYRMEPNGDLTSSDMLTGNIEAGKFKSYTGSYVSNTNFGLSVGVGRNSNDEFYYGAFLDAGYGSYETYNEAARGLEVKGGGDNMHIGVGAFAKLAFGANLDSTFYTTARVGYSKLDFWADSYKNGNFLRREVDSSDFKLSRIYFGLTGEVAHRLGSYWYDGNFDAFARLSYLGVTSDDVKLPREDFTVDATHSLTARVGFRYTETLNEAWTSYISAAFEREFLGESSGTNNKQGYALTDYITAPTMKGNSGVGEIGFTYDTKNTQDGGFVINFKLLGSVGTNRGWGGGFDLKYRF